MKLTRHGKHRDKGTNMLFEGKPDFEKLRLKPIEGHSSSPLKISFSGIDRNNNYDYQLELSCHEILDMLSHIINKDLTNQSESLIAKASLFSLNELLIKSDNHI